MKEYYNNPDATRKTIVDGWLLTGDIAKCDADGFKKEVYRFRRERQDSGPRTFCGETSGRCYS